MFFFFKWSALMVEEVVRRSKHSLKRLQKAVIKKKRREKEICKGIKKKKQMDKIKSKKKRRALCKQTTNTERRG